MLPERAFQKRLGGYAPATLEGGGGWNPVSWVSDAFQSAGDALASIDPGPAIGQGLAEADTFVNRELPGGWTLPAIITAAVLAPELAPELAQTGIEGGIDSEIGKDAFWTAIQNGASGQEAVNFGLAAQQAGTTLTPAMIEYVNASGDPIGTLNAISGMTPEQFASATQLIGGPATAEGLTAGQDLAELMKSYPNLSESQLQDILKINYGADPTVAADAANLAKNGYDAATINQVLSYSYTPAELTGTGIESFAPESAQGLSAKEVLSNVNRARQLANLLSAGGSTVKAASIPTAQQWTQNAQQVALNQPAQEQFGGLYQMNKNPFTFQNPLANALAGNKPATGLDVSGTPGTALNTQQQNQIYSSLLRSA
jgi:hypothetical protein